MAYEYRPMRRSFLRHSAAAFAVGAASAWPALLRAEGSRSYLLGTGTTGGTYYPVGVAIATLVKVKVKLEPKAKIAMSAITSAGSGENLKLLREDQVQFAILQGLWGAHARAGSGPLANVGPQEHLRGISML